jgi:putative membrane protein
MVEPQVTSGRPACISVILGHAWNYLHAMEGALHRLWSRLRLRPPGFINREPLDLNAHLALVRTRLSNERTLLSYIRSSLYLLIGGITLVQVEGFGDLHYVGILALFLCVASLLVGLLRFQRLRRELDHFYLPPERPQEGPGSGA